MWLHIYIALNELSEQNNWVDMYKDAEDQGSSCFIIMCAYSNGMLHDWVFIET